MFQNVLIEGFTAAELLNLSAEQIDNLVPQGVPLVFHVGSAEILGQFRRTSDRLIVELAQVDGGGEGVLPTLWIVVNRYAEQRDIEYIEWIIHALTCIKPNPKLQRVLERLDFQIENMPGIGWVYHRVTSAR